MACESPLKPSTLAGGIGLIWSAAIHRRFRGAISLSADCAIPFACRDFSGMPFFPLPVP
jgi:hypothetical protein